MPSKIKPQDLRDRADFDGLRGSFEVPFKFEVVKTVEDTWIVGSDPGRSIGELLDELVERVARDGEKIGDFEIDLRALFPN